jgi:hypothetical protein
MAKNNPVKITAEQSSQTDININTTAAANSLSDVATDGLAAGNDISPSIENTIVANDGNPVDSDAPISPVTANDEMILDEQDDEDSVKVKAKEMLDEFMEPYLSAYPNEVMFFITTDGHVFLSSSENDALNHQRRIDNTKEPIEYFRG